MLKEQRFRTRSTRCVQGPTAIGARLGICLKVHQIDSNFLTWCSTAYTYHQLLCIYDQSFKRFSSRFPVKREKNRIFLALKLKISFFQSASSAIFRFPHLIPIFAILLLSPLQQHSIIFPFIC